MVENDFCQLGSVAALATGMVVNPPMRASATQTQIRQAAYHAASPQRILTVELDAFDFYLSTGESDRDRAAKMANTMRAYVGRSIRYPSKAAAVTHKKLHLHSFLYPIFGVGNAPGFLTPTG